MKRYTHPFFAAWLTLVALGCTPPPPVKTADDDARIAGDATIPVTDADPSVGDKEAPVTLVVFGDYECPHCRSANALVAELAAEYGPSRLRVVWKHFPLDPESTGRAAAELSIAVRELAGDAAFWEFHRGVYGKTSAGALDQRVASAIANARNNANVDLKALGKAAASSGRTKVQADIDLGEKLGVRALPSLFINGVFFEGIGKKSDLTEVIDKELAATEALASQKVARGSIYERRVRENLAAAASPSMMGAGAGAGEDVDDGMDPIDETIFNVPLGSSPASGNPNALVTLVEFADFECIYCAGTQKTLEQVRERYGDKVRFVFKHNPLPFHERATPAANLAMEIRAQKGDAAFYRAATTLFSARGQLSDIVFDAVAQQAGISADDARRAMRDQKHAQAIESDMLLADDVGATGTPYFYVNGTRIKGARSFARFTRIIDAELVKAQALVDAGKAPDKVYAEIMSKAEAPEPPERFELPPPSKNAPARGPKDAPVTVRIFADFQCGYCRIHAKRMDDLEQAFPGQLRFVFHNFPLEGHDRARPAAIAALEARRQKGDDAFFKMHDSLFAGQKSLDDEGLLSKADALGLDVAKMRTELAGTRFDKQLAEDAALAAKLDVTGTPATFINGYRVGGAATLVRFKKVVRQALADKAAPSSKPSK
jgi:protein-disulfide isomerase